MSEMNTKGAHWLKLKVLDIQPNLERPKRACEISCNPCDGGFLLSGLNTVPGPNEFEGLLLPYELGAQASLNRPLPPGAFQGVWFNEGGNSIIDPHAESLSLHHEFGGIGTSRLSGKALARKLGPLGLRMWLIDCEDFGKVVFESYMTWLIEMFLVNRAYRLWKMAVTADDVGLGNWIRPSAKDLLEPSSGNPSVKELVKSNFWVFERGSLVLTPSNSSYPLDTRIAPLTWNPPRDVLTKCCPTKANIEEAVRTLALRYGTKTKTQLDSGRQEVVRGFAYAVALAILKNGLSRTTFVSFQPNLDGTISWLAQPQTRNLLGRVYLSMLGELLPWDPTTYSRCCICGAGLEAKPGEKRKRSKRSNTKTCGARCRQRLKRVLDHGKED